MIMMRTRILILDGCNIIIGGTGHGMGRIVNSSIRCRESRVSNSEQHMWLAEGRKIRAE